MSEGCKWGEGGAPKARYIDAGEFGIPSYYVNGDLPQTVPDRAIQNTALNLVEETVRNHPHTDRRPFSIIRGTLISELKIWDFLGDDSLPNHVSLRGAFGSFDIGGIITVAHYFSERTPQWIDKHIFLV